MTLWILQISDLHFGQSSRHLPPRVALAAVSAAVGAVLREQPAPLLVALCGDVVEKGDRSYFDVAARALESELLGPLGRPSVVCCPGNHDVVADENGNFSAFNRFAFRITNNAGVMFDRSRTVATVSVGGYELVLANSMFEGHETFKVGKVDVDVLGQVLGGTASGPRVVLTHHSLIPSSPADSSSVANAYPMLRAITSSGVLAVLHGHMHSQSILTIGKSGTAVIGVGSLLFKPYPNYNNGFNLLRFEGGMLTGALAFRYVADSVHGPSVGTFERMELPII